MKTPAIGRRGKLPTEMHLVITPVNYGCNVLSVFIFNCREKKNISGSFPKGILKVIADVSIDIDEGESYQKIEKLSEN